MSFKQAVDEMRADLKKVYREVLPQASAAALNQTAWKTRDLLKDDMASLFDRPTPQTLRGILVKRATADDLTAIISIKDNSPRSKSAPPVGHYLAAEILGGDRSPKRSDVALRLAGVMQSSQFALPSKQDVLNGYGNLPASQIIQVLSSVKAFGEQGYLANATKRSKGRRKGFKTTQSGTPFFVAKSKSTGLPLGIWEVVAPGKVKPVLIFADRAPDYPIRFPFYDLVQEHAGVLFAAEMEKALRALAAKP